MSGLPDSEWIKEARVSHHP